MKNKLFPNFRTIFPLTYNIKKKFIDFIEDNYKNEKNELFDYVDLS